MTKRIPHPKQHDLFGFTTKEKRKLDKKKRNNRRSVRSAKRRAR